MLSCSSQSNADSACPSLAGERMQGQFCPMEQHCPILICRFSLVLSMWLDSEFCRELFQWWAFLVSEVTPLGNKKQLWIFLFPAFYLAEYYLCVVCWLWSRKIGEKIWLNALHYLPGMKLLPHLLLHQACPVALSSWCLWVRNYKSSTTVNCSINKKQIYKIWLNK